MKNRLLRELPSVDEILRGPGLREALARCSAAVVAGAVREALSHVRGEIMSGRLEAVSPEGITGLALEGLKRLLSPGIVKVINATGTILHTNVGRAVLSEEAAAAVDLAARNHVNLEFDLDTGERGFRDSSVEGLLKRLAGCEGASVVNNNAAAVFITLNTLAEGGEVVISRGELVEIGGSFRLHEIIKKSGCVLKEVGTTNRTHPADYVNAITGDTALLLKVHRSNFTVSGFTAEVGLKELVEIGKKHNLPVVEDLGSGALIDLARYGLPSEPVVRDRLACGAQVVTFSGDKLLGGPQAGLIAGTREAVARINRNPLKRVLRPGKMTLGALDATLRLYLDPERLTRNLPTLRFMTRGTGELEERAREAAALLKDALGPDFTVTVEDEASVTGGGSLPGHEIATKVVALTHDRLTPDRIYRMFLDSSPPVIGRIKNGRFMLDMRTVERPGDVVPAVKGGSAI